LIPLNDDTVVVDSVMYSAAAIIIVSRDALRPHSTTPTPTSSPTFSRGSSRGCQHVGRLPRSASHRNNFRKSRVSNDSARILASMSVSVSMSVSWNAGFTTQPLSLFVGGISYTARCSGAGGHPAGRPSLRRAVVGGLSLSLFLSQAPYSSGHRPARNRVALFNRRTHTHTHTHRDGRSEPFVIHE